MWIHLSLCAIALAAKQPNLVLMVLDDVGWADVGYHGSDFPTPNVDRLARQGLRLERFYVQPSCSPTRSALLTGRYPHRLGMQHCSTILPGSSARLPADAPTLAELLRDAGYSTAAIGKWHLGYDSWDATPTGRGFDSHAGYFQAQTSYYKKTVTARGVGDGVDFWRNRTCAWEETDKYSMDFYMREAARVLDERDPRKPLFLYFGHQHLHVPLEEPPEPKYGEECSKHLDRSSPDGLNRHMLCTMMSRLDSAIGEFEQMLKDRGLWEETLLWVTTDNGGMPQFSPDFPASASSNYPLRAGKMTLFEGGVRGVSFLTGGLLPTSAGGKEYDGLLQHVDVPVTLARLAGVNVEGDGLDVWQTLASGGPSPRSEAVLNVDVSNMVKVCVQLAKLPRRSPEDPEVSELQIPHGVQNSSAILQDHWKLINGWSGGYDGYWSNEPYLRTEADYETQGPVKMGGDFVWLFDLKKDPSERRNVARDNPAIVARLQARLLQLADPAQGFVPPQRNTPSLLAMPALHNGTWAPWKPSKTDAALV